LVSSLLTPLAFAVSVSVYYDDTKHCDPLMVPAAVDELGIGNTVSGAANDSFPMDEDISAFSFESHLSVCRGPDSPKVPKSIVSTSNLTIPKRSFHRRDMWQNPISTSPVLTDMSVHNEQRIEGGRGFSDRRHR